jgi:tRNA pseudouridine38-40 synthase
MIPRTIRLLIAYDGGRYQGWQRQKSAPTIQGTIEQVLERVTQQPVTLIGAGRTDAGVHAWGQVAHFHSLSRLTPIKIHEALNGLLPEDILVREAGEANPEFHARYSCTSKVYDYYLWNRPVLPPFFRHYLWRVKGPLDLDLMRQGLSLLEGEHDFSSFQSQGSQVASPVRTLFQAGLSVGPWGVLRIRFKAGGFLRHMVRNMVGSLIELGRKKNSLEGFAGILNGRDRSLAGEMAPARGLFLRKVFYGKGGSG